MAWKIRIAETAKQHYRQILAVSREGFGEQTARRYKDLLDKAFSSVADDPYHSQTKQRDEILSGIRTMHLRNMPNRVRKPRHIIVFRVADDNTVEVLAILHERMELIRHLRDDAS